MTRITSLLAPILLAAPLAVLAACSGKREAEPAPSPTSYRITAQDLKRAEVTDICRAGDAGFLNALVLRVSALLPPGTSGFAFDDFDVRESEEGAQAVLHFHARLPGEKSAPFTARGAFTPARCTVGPLQGHGGEGEPIGPAIFTEGD